MAIIADLTAWIPFWNSLDAVRRIHSVFELTSIIFFALLALFEGLALWIKDKAKERRYEVIGMCCFVIAVVCEGVAYPYGQRNDSLSGRVILSLSEKSDEAAISAHSALFDSGNAKTQADAAKLSAAGAVTKADAAATKAIEAASKANEAGKKANEAGTKVDVVNKKAEQIDADLKRSTAELNRYIGEIVKRGNPRGVDSKLLFEALKGKPNDANVAIWYAPEDPESYTFAMEIWQFLGPGIKAKDGFDGAGWNVSFPKPIPNLRLPPREPGSTVFSSSTKLGPGITYGPAFLVPMPLAPGAPLTAQFVGNSTGGLTFLSRHPVANVVGGSDGPANTALKALTWAMVESTGLGVVNQQWAELDPNVIIVVVTRSTQLVRPR